MSKKIFLLDNYDSFTYNLAHMLQALRADVVVRRNDEVSVDEVAEYDFLVLSPGPGLPSDAGKMPQIIQKYSGVKPILGVCLGCQGLAEHYGAVLYNIPDIQHGQPTPLRWQPTGRLTEAADALPAVGGLYHSWAIERHSLPAEILPLAFDDRDILMAWEHRTDPTWGVQFHPESIMTDHGKELLQAWLKVAKSFAVGDL